MFHTAIVWFEFIRDISLFRFRQKKTDNNCLLPVSPFAP
jgi:hypothetical protein